MATVEKNVEKVGSSEKQDCRLGLVVGTENFQDLIRKDQESMHTCVSYWLLMTTCMYVCLSMDTFSIGSFGPLAAAILGIILDI